MPWLEFRRVRNAGQVLMEAVYVGRSEISIRKRLEVIKTFSLSLVAKEVTCG